jgi:hypothetical protein
VAEEIIAVRLVEEASDRLQARCEDGQLTEREASAAIDELHGLFELFEDDDVLAMFEMSEPADAALAGHDPLNRMTGGCRPAARELVQAVRRNDRDRLHHGRRLRGSTPLRVQ